MEASARPAPDFGQRVVNYFQRLTEFRVAQAVVHQPYFNSSRNPECLKAYEEIGAWLKQEADALWSVGVSVY